MPDIVRPRLPRGARLAVVSPASAAKPEAIEQGCENLRAYGYTPQVMPHAMARGPLYYAGTAEQRVADLHAAFADDSIDGVICTRGGWGSAELLPLLDLELLRTHPKPFIGYSDHTSLHICFWNDLRMQSFYAPMVAADWSKQDCVDLRSWELALCGPVKGVDWAVAEHDGMRSLQQGRAHGRLLGGCLSILLEGLATPWALRIEEPCVLFLEDIGTKPYKWDRFLQHLRFAGMLENVTGIVLGDMSANIEPNESELLENACLHALRQFEGPIAIGLRCGHVERSNHSLVLGAQVTLHCDDVCRLTLASE